MAGSPPRNAMLTPVNNCFHTIVVQTTKQAGMQLFPHYPCRAFSLCFCSPSRVSDIPTRSSANKHESRHRFYPHRDPLLLLLRLLRSGQSVILTLNRLVLVGDSVHPCATPCKISTYFDIFPSSITALLTHSVIFFIILHIFPLIPISHNVFHNPFLRTVSWAFCTPRNKLYRVTPASFLPWINLPNVYT